MMSNKSTDLNALKDSRINSNNNIMQHTKDLLVSGPMKQRRRIEVQELNNIISCYLCDGYLINPATVEECLHSYCRSCIVQHLKNDTQCPQCRAAGAYDSPGGRVRHITTANLKSDVALRSLIFKLVPGLYQQECDRMLRFSSKLQTYKDHAQLTVVSSELANGCDNEEHYFSPTEPISLSLEYHPALLATCSKDEIPPVRYLLCPAGFMIHHLKHFLCSKYDIDPENKQVEIEIIYEGENNEEEVLPNDFTLMDVGYCYNWKRVGPMRFTYRILIHSETTQDLAEIRSNSKVNQDTSLPNKKQHVQKSTSLRDDANSVTHKTVRFAEEKTNLSTKLDNTLPPPMTYTVFKSKAQEYRLGAHNNNNNKTSASSLIEKEFDEQMLNDGNGPVKVIIARKPAVETKKGSPKRAHSLEEPTYTVTTNDFKSLRSNDIRYSDYTVTSTTNSNSVNKSKQKQPKTNEKDKLKIQNQAQVSKCDIVVSIPQSQMTRVEENVSLSQLKTANKKSPPQIMQSTLATDKSKNVPKLKIELGSLKTKITIPKPKSAGVCGAEPEHKKSKHRKLSVDECGPTADKVDLETYVKNIGLKPIEVVTAPQITPDVVEKGKYSPDASPMSSSSSTASSNGNFVFNSSAEISSSSHKKRKKKHSRDSKDSNGKRRKLHAEISSQPADESLKMKVKITASHNHKPHKVESRKSSSSNDDVVVMPLDEKLESNGKKLETINKLDVNMSTLNKTLSEESSNINNLITAHPSTVHSNDMPKIMTTVHSSLSPLSKATDHLTLSAKPLLPKPLSNIKDIKIPSSPPLPPSLFKTAPMTLTTSTISSPPVKIMPNLLAPFAPTKVTTQKITTKPSSPVQSQPPALVKQSTLAKSQNFLVPNPPKLCALPTSIASSANKNLKRSASVDEMYHKHQLSRQQAEKPMRKMAAYTSPAGNLSLMRTNSAGQKESNSKKSAFYSAYSPEANKRKILPMNLPPTSISVSTINEAYPIYSNPRISTPPALTLTSHPKQTTPPQMINFLPFPSLAKPALEIVRIAASQAPAEKLPLPPNSPPKAVRPAQPPIPLLKIRKPGQPNATSPPLPSTAVRSPPTSSKTSPPALVSMRSAVPLSVTAKAATAYSKEKSAFAEESKQNNGGLTTATAQDKPKASLRDFRPTSKDGSVEILDLSSSKTQDTQKPTSASAMASVGNSLEAALNKIKQNMTSNTVSDSLQSNKLSAGKVNPSDDLQNLHLLSESATNREKIAIKPQQKLYEMSKVPQAPTVRQQNASVRNIPNPSALAFRNQPSLSLLASVASPPSPQTNTNQPASPSAANDAKTLSPPTSMFTTSPKSPSLQTTNQSSPRTKKLTSIDQVAATLNIRAAAAEAEASAAAKASAVASSHSEDSSLVSSTSTTIAKNGSKVNTTEATSTSLVSSTVSSSTTASNVKSATNNSSENQAAQLVAITAAAAAAATSSVTPTVPKTSFKSVSSLVATTSSTPTTVTGSA